MKGTPNSHKTDVLICGSGSAGLMAALWLAKYGVSFRVLERRDGPLVIGQADGVQTRSVEIFESFGILDPLIRQSYHMMETAVWAPDPDLPLVAGEAEGGGLKRQQYIADVNTKISHQLPVVLHQGRIQELIINEMLKRGGPEIEYGYDVKDVDIDAGKAADPNAYPAKVTAVKDGVDHVFQAKYVLACDGAHSAVRRAVGIKMVGDTTDSVWGVMDVYPRTDFPDIRKKIIIQSVAGNLLGIPREGDSLVRFYIELPQNTVPSQVTLKDLHDRVKVLFRPFEIEIPETAWWSAYVIGQRLAENFHVQHRLFLTGDACHTHSPKAGQGMNVSMQDGYNIGWKLGAYLTGQANFDLVKTYVTERQQTATDLIEFDRVWSQIFKTKDTGYTGDGSAASWTEYLRKQFLKFGKFTAGLAYKYSRSIIVQPPEGEKAENGISENTGNTELVVGMRFPSAQVVRNSDSRTLQLLSLIKSDRRWRIVVFAGDIQQEGVRSSLQKVAESIGATIRKFTPEGEDQDSIIEPLLVLKTKRTELEVHQIPDVFKPVTGEHRIRNLHKVFIDDESLNMGHGHAFDKLGVDSNAITTVVVRPDQYISLVSSSEEVGALGSFFNKFMTTRA
ncbi:3-hydroxybenzoate 4-monooxygenase [Cytospora mali]|uniref:3-hydroxybenzoate 4-monooxygenase n=1 Tax=Cytospora mali TaxID=578113 RepID=A0A194W7E6_CYTMA|nr:3-hydroxybenzoate 4-monooxygenase [Valsa mali]